MYARTTESNGTSRFLSAHANRHPFLRGLLVLVALLIAVSLGGCDSAGPTGSTPPDSPAEPDSRLRPGGTASTDSGVRIMASKGTIDDEMSVSGSEMADPTSETPMPDFARPSGPYHRVASGRNVEVATDEPPLYLALPVPEGADTSRLALAVRVPQKYTTDNAQASSEYGWSVVRGVYEPERGLLVTPIRFLMKRGTAFTVVESDDHTSPSMAGTDGETLFAKTQNFFSLGAKASATAKSTAKSNRFVVKCVGFDNSSACGADEKKDVRQYLNKAVQDFVGGFQFPALARTYFSKKPVWKIYESGESWCKGAAGKYLFLTDVAITCYDGNGDPAEGTTRHEFFHAIQYSYAPISLHNWPVADWILEGTAELAEPTSASAGAAAVRGPDPLRNVDRKLTVEMEGPNPEYNVQDFWVYLINRRNATLKKILEPVFSVQPSVPNKPFIFKIDQLYSITDDHWGWVRNQTIEAHEATGNADLTASCVFDPESVTGSPQTVSYDVSAQSKPLTRTVTLDRLTASVVKVRFSNTGGSTQRLGVVKAQSSTTHGQAKAYAAHGSSTGACLGTAGSTPSASIDQVLPAGAKDSVYVLLSYSDPTETEQVRFDLTAKVPPAGTSKPAVQIVSPPDRNPVDGPVITLRADASDPDGGSIRSVEWTITVTVPPPA